MFFQKYFCQKFIFKMWVFGNVHQPADQSGVVGPMTESEFQKWHQFKD